MPTLLARLGSAVLTLPLLISKPVLRLLAARERRSGAWRQRPPSREAESTRPEPAIRALQATPDATVAMRDELRRVLDQDESHRKVFPHLARFERKFAKYGLRAVAELPIDQVRRALADFEALVRNWSSASLADLRSRMAVVLADRASAASVWIAANSVSAAGRPGPESMAGRLRRHAGATLGVGRQRAPRHLGMSRFELGDGGFHSTSARA
ncbi:MAG: hypothetical protein ACXWJ7_16555 [Caldimonas sp.]